MNIITENNETDEVKLFWKEWKRKNNIWSDDNNV